MLQCSVCLLSVCLSVTGTGWAWARWASAHPEKIRVGQDIKTSARLSTLSWLTSGLPNSTAASTSLSLSCGMNKLLVIERVLTGTVQPDDIVSSWFYNHLVFITSSNHWFDSWSRSVICLTATKPTVWCYKQARPTWCSAEGTAGRRPTTQRRARIYLARIREGWFYRKRRI